MKTKSALAVVLAVVSLAGVTQPVFAVTKTDNEYLNSAEFEKQVRKYFSDIPVMIEIARCESKFRQYTDSGSVLRGGVGGGMVGVFQFYESIHAAGAKALGFDLATLNGNMAYAKHLYKSEGTTPWNSASNCWKTSSFTNAAATSVTITDTAKRAKLLEQINILTKLISLLKKQIEAKKY